MRSTTSIARTWSNSESRRRHRSFFPCKASVLDHSGGGQSHLRENPAWHFVITHRSIACPTDPLCKALEYERWNDKVQIKWPLLFLQPSGWDLDNLTEFLIHHAIAVDTGDAILVRHDIFQLSHASVSTVSPVTEPAKDINDRGKLLLMDGYQDTFFLYPCTPNKTEYHPSLIYTRHRNQRWYLKSNSRSPVFTFLLSSISPLAILLFRLFCRLMYNHLTTISTCATPSAPTLKALPST